jgi:uncharacterized protein DUF932
MLRALSRYNPYEAMTADDVIARFPVLRQDQGKPGLSAKYQHIDTAGPLRRMESAGFRVHGIDIQGTRGMLSPRDGYQKHMLRLRLPGIADVAPGTTPEICFRNAHDGCGAYALFVGMFRGFCWNGIVVGSVWGAFKVPHIGKDIETRVLEATHKVVDGFSVLRDVVANWQDIELSRGDQLEFANQAQLLRYDPDAETGTLPLAPAAMNFARREADIGNSLWLTYNRVQESLISGGVYGVTGPKARRFKSRGIKAIDENVRINRQLFSLAESWAGSKRSPAVADRAAFAGIEDAITL